MSSYFRHGSAKITVSRNIFQDIKPFVLVAIFFKPDGFLILQVFHRLFNGKYLILLSTMVMLLYNSRTREAVMATREEKKQQVIDVLNKARASELTAIHQYMNQHYGLDDMDYGELAAQIKLIAIDEMRHAEMFAERVKELGGEPVTEKDAGIEKHQDIEAIFPFNVELEEGAVEAYNEFLEVCRENGDSTSMKIFEEIIDEEQEHLNYFDSIAGHIKKLGTTYLAKIAGTSSATGLNSQGFVARKGGA